MLIANESAPQAHLTELGEIQPHLPEVAEQHSAGATPGQPLKRLINLHLRSSRAASRQSRSTFSNNDVSSHHVLSHASSRIRLPNLAADTNLAGSSSITSTRQ